MNRRRLLALASQAGVLSTLTGVVGSRPSFAEESDHEANQSEKPVGHSRPIKHWMVRYGGVTPVVHDRLGTTISGQTAVTTVRFFRPVRVDRVVIPPIVYDRGWPPVPCHPARFVVSIFDRGVREWRIIREEDVPLNPKFAGEGLRNGMPEEELQAFFVAALREQKPYVIELEGMVTDHLRVECPREHPTWPNAGEQNGGIYNVPFGIFNSLEVHGEPLQELTTRQPYLPTLTQGKIAPRAPEGMKVTVDARSVWFVGSQLRVAFSLHRPLLMHLGWDALGQGRNEVNRLLETRTFGEWSRISLMGDGLSGPFFQTLEADSGAQLWSGEIEVSDNEIRYSNLKAEGTPRLDIAIKVWRDRIEFRISQHADRPIDALDYEAWRFAWDLVPSLTGVAGVPTERRGRNGHVKLPALLVGEGSGCLEMNWLHSGAGGDESFLQVESYRDKEAVSCGIVPAVRSADGFGVTIPAGTRHADFVLKVVNLEPAGISASHRAKGEPDGVRQHWSTIFACFRPEYRGFSNHSASTNFLGGEYAQTEIVLYTEQPPGSPDLSALHRFTTEKAILDGGGYGYWRTYFMDTDPALLCAAGTMYRMDRRQDWLQRIQPGLNEIFDRMSSKARDDGLLLQKYLSGNSGQFTRSSNGIDVTCFGWLDAFSNAWAYRGLRNAAPLFAALGDARRMRRAIDLANRMQQSYGREFINPKTGWVVGWKSEDGKLHDYGYLGINGIAIAFGVLHQEDARRALTALEAERAKVCSTSTDLGLPYNLFPTPYRDQYFWRLINGSEPTFEMFCDGGMSTLLEGYYIRALAENGFKDTAHSLALALDRGYRARYFTGGMGSGAEMRTWEGLPSGYEGTLIYSLSALYAVAVEKGYLVPRDPEWWPAMPGHLRNS